MASALLLVSAGCTSENLDRLTQNARDDEDPHAGNHGLRADVYSFTDGTKKFVTKMLTRVDTQVNFDFGNNGPDLERPTRQQDAFAIRWTGYLRPPKTGKYVLCMCSDDGTSMVFNGEKVYDQMQSQAARFWWSGVMELQEKTNYPIRIDYFDGNSTASAKLYWALNPTGTAEETCSSTAPAGAATPGQNYECTTDRILNPALQIVPSSALVAATNEIDKEFAACKVNVENLPLDQIPDPLDRYTQQARRLFQRLGGVDVPITDSRVKRVKELLQAGRKKEAGRVVIQDPSFYDITVRAMAAEISTRAETTNVPLNDFIATVIGVTRDRINARKLLTGNFVYRAKPILGWGDMTVYARPQTISSNRHYENLEDMGLPLACALDTLDRNDPDNPPSHMKQMIALPQPTVGDTNLKSAMMENQDPAGLLTSRSFAEAHMIAGTNRRAVQKALEYFACAKLDSYRDTEIPDDYVVRDVERFPNGPDSHRDYQNTCKSCHANLDAMRGAFAYLHFENGIMKDGRQFLNNRRGINNNMEQEDNMRLTPIAPDGSAPINNTTIPANSVYIPVAWKMNHNVNYLDGAIAKDNKWRNYLTSDAQMARFEWSGGTSGTGVREFGRMISNSGAFPKCMARRVYKTVCKDDPFAPEFSAETSRWLDQVGEGFARYGYDMQDLFVTVATSCL